MAMARGLAADAEEIHETHISRVFLRGDRAIKVKKAVDLGFLDFSTKEARRKACEDEVRLNRRLALDVYLGVAPVVNTGLGLRLGPLYDPEREEPRPLGAASGARADDWAVVMRRLPEDRRADVLLARGELNDAHLRAIAHTLVGFHARAAPRTPPPGGRATVEQNVEENFAQTAHSRSRFLRPEEGEEIERVARRFLAERGERLDARAAEGRVREGHGDLRLEHIYLGPEEDEPSVRVIDCIEFNERFRIADVAADIAFLGMDLAWHDHPAKAERLLALYAAEAGDFDLYGVLDFYESYRAYVRAKVATFLVDDESAPAALKARAEAEARRYYLLALAAERPPVERPRVLAVGGLIGSGKSTLADALGRALPAVVVESDRTRKQMLHRRPTERLDDEAWQGAYSPGFTEEVYAEVIRRAEAALRAGRSVIIDASFRSRAMREEAQGLARRHDVPFAFVELHTPAAVCKARLAEREKSASVSDGRLAIFDAFAARYEEARELSREEKIEIDGARSVEDQVGDVVRRLADQPVSPEAPTAF